METVKKEIFEYLEDNDISDKEFALSIGCKPSLVSDVRKGTKNFNFRALLKCSFLMYKEHHNEVIANWCLKIDNTEGIKHAFEYASLTKNHKLLNLLLNKYSNSTGVLKECVTIYGLLYDFITFKFPEEKLIDSVRLIRGITTKSLLLLTEVLKVIGYYYNKKYELMLEMLPELESQISLLSDRELFIKECYMVRVSSAYAPAYFQLNDTNGMKYHANILLNAEFCAKMVADGYYYMGMSYLTKDKERALRYLSLNHDIQSGVSAKFSEHSLSNLNFARSFLGLSLQGVEIEPTIRIYNKLKTGQKISEYEKEIITNSSNTLPFKKYYIGLAEKSEKLLIESINDFVRNKQLFFASLVIYDLKKFNPNLLVIDSFIQSVKFIEGDGLCEKENFNCFGDFRSNSISGI